MIDKAIAIAILVAIGFCIKLLFDKFKIKITYIRLLLIWGIGVLIFTVGKNTTLYFIGIALMVISTALFLFDILVNKPKLANQKEEEINYSKLMLAANNRQLNDDEAYQLLQKANRLETKGQFEDAIKLYELIILNNASASADAKICLREIRNKLA